MTERKWLVPVVVKTIVWETATVTVSAEGETKAMLAAIANNYDGLEYDGDGTSREIRVDRVGPDASEEEVA